MSDIDPQEFGELKAQVAFLVDHIKELRTKVDKIDERMAEAKGGWKALMLLGGGSATFGAGITAALSHFFKGGGPVS